MVLFLVVVMVLVVSHILVLVSWCPGALVSRCLADCGVLQEGGPRRRGAVKGRACHAGRARRMRGDPPTGGPRQRGRSERGGRKCRKPNVCVQGAQHCAAVAAARSGLGSL